MWVIRQLADGPLLKQKKVSFLIAIGKPTLYILTTRLR